MKYNVVTRWLARIHAVRNITNPVMGLDAGVSLARSLLRLAECNLGLVVITTREHLANVEGHATTEEQKLEKLSHDAADVGAEAELHAAGQEHGRLRALYVSASGHLISVSQAVSRSTGTGYSTSEHALVRLRIRNQRGASVGTDSLNWFVVNRNDLVQGLKKPVFA